MFLAYVKQESYTYVWSKDSCINQKRTVYIKRDSQKRPTKCQKRPTNVGVAHVCVLRITFVDGYCSTVQGLLDWFEVDIGFTELSFIQIDLCV